MRDDLLEAQAVINWAEAQIIFMQERFLEWQRSYPYEFMTEPDTQTGGQFLLVRHKWPLYPYIQIDAAMIVHAIRSSLDILMGSLVTRNGKPSGSHPHFPIRKSEADWDSYAAKKIKGEGWLSDAQITTIKDTWPYPGTDGLLYSLHHLDITSKHYRLLTATPTITGSWLTNMRYGIEPHVRRFDDKTILYRLAPGASLNPSQGNTSVTAEITVNEPRFGIQNEEAFNLLRRYVAKATDVIALFDTP